MAPRVNKNLLTVAPPCSYNTTGWQSKNQTSGQGPEGRNCQDAHPCGAQTGAHRGGGTRRFAVISMAPTTGAPGRRGASSSPLIALTMGGVTYGDGSRASGVTARRSTLAYGHHTANGQRLAAFQRDKDRWPFVY
jgi:hypothetical protein